MNKQFNSDVQFYLLIFQSKIKMSSSKTRSGQLQPQPKNLEPNAKNPAKILPKQKAEEQKQEESKHESSRFEEEMIELTNEKQLSELPSLRELNHVLEDSSDDDSDENSNSLTENTEQKRKRHGEHLSDIKVTQHLILRKRDVKGNYKAKFNLEKLMIEHEKKQIQLKELYQKQEDITEQIGELRSEIGKKLQTSEIVETKPTQGKIHSDYFLYEMQWMANDFEREHKKKMADLKKSSRICKKQIQEKKLKTEKELKDIKLELRRKAGNMSKMVTMFWKSVEKVVKHNYNVLYEKKRSQIRAKKLENFVSKHLKLSVKVAEELNTNKFMEQSMKNKLPEVAMDDNQKLMKLYNSQDAVTHMEGVQNGFIQGELPTKRRNLTVLVHKDSQGFYNLEEQEEEEKDNQQIHSQTADDQGLLSRTLIAEQTVEMAKSFQPTGFTLSSVQVKTKVPFLLHGSLREYQIIGLDWLVTLHNKKLNGILADEMGLGKTIQTISMLASMACDKGIWGPHLIVVPTTIIINWEMEFKKWCPAFKILTYFGSQKERKMKRHGWSKENSFHVCITSYKLVIQDHFAFRRKKWYYMVLDEAQNIKNFKSQRWQTLLRFNTKRRLLLTGTPLQNDVMELWSLMHFLMPNIFSSQQDFKEWFSNPFNQSINQNQSLNISVVQKLQSILRPFLLRRMKKDVEKQLPEKVEHIVQCNLSRRQRLLYDEYINSDKTKQTLNESDFFSIMNVLMQLRKVCNHPDLFEPRTIESPFIMQERVKYHFSSFLYKAFQENPMKDINYKSMNFVLSEFENMSQLEYQRLQELYPARPLIQVISESKNHLDDISETLMTSRPLAEGYAQGKKLPINCNVFAKQNTKNLYHTIPSVFPQESNSFHSIPSYLNTACLPFAQQYYSQANFNESKYSTKTKPYNEFDVYQSALQPQEMNSHLIKYGQKLQQWRDADTRNRFNLLFQKPIYGEDCRKAIKINLVFGDVFEAKRHKNLDRHNKTSQYAQNDLESVPSTVLNPFAMGLLESRIQMNKVENWPELTEQQIEDDSGKNTLIQEVPKSQQIKRRKRQQQLQQQQALRLQQQALMQYQYRYETVQYTEKVFSLIISKAALTSLDSLSAKQSEPSNEQEPSPCLVLPEDTLNPNLEVKIEEIVKQRVEERKIQVIQQFGNTMEAFNQGGDMLNGGSQEQQRVNASDDTLYESPYQRVYQNASKRYKKENGEENQVEESGEGQDQKNQMEIEGENHGNVGEPKEKGEEEEKNRDELFQIDGSAKGHSQETKKEDIQMTDEQDQQHTGQNEEQKESQHKPESLIQQSPSFKFPMDQQDQQMDLGDQEEDPEEDEDDENSSHQVTYKNCEVLRDFIITPLQRVSMLEETIKQFKFIIPKVVAQTPDFIPTQMVTENLKAKAYERFAFQKLMSHRNVNQSLKYSNILFFPHKNLIQYDCGKLQKLAQLLKHLHSRNHKILIFTQMTRILDILENFLNLHGYTYVRLDGSVKVEMRQRLVDKFNLNKKIFCFISSTRCGGIGINLTGADCVIFYDTDWNPAMDKQAQDRCHRIGSKAKTINIYRLISTNTIEENIFKKSLQKRELGGLIIEGNFDMDFFKKVSLKDIIGDENFFRPKKIDIMKEENIVFHLTNDSGNNMTGNFTGEGEENEMDYEKQRQIEQYRRRFEEALVRIEDKEDIIALQNAKREIDDEFDEGAALGQQDTRGDTSIVEPQPSNADQEEGEHQAQAQQKDHKSTNQLSRELKKNEFVNWRSHATLNDVTKMCIDYYEHNYDFDEYLLDRSKKDTKFVNPLEKEEEKKERGDKQMDDEEAKEEAKEREGSEFSFSEEDEEMSHGHDQGEDWDFRTAENMYKGARDEIESKYFIV